MKLLYVVETPLFPLNSGGAKKSNHSLCRALVKQGDFDVCVLQIGDKSEVPMEGYITYTTRLRNFSNLLRFKINDYKPDLILLQNCSATTTRVAMNSGVQCMTYLRTAFAPPKLIWLAHHAGCKIIGNSIFIQKRYNDICGGDVGLVYSIIDEDYRVPYNRDGFITMMNTAKVKGSEIFLEIAENMPKEKFLFVAVWDEKGEDGDIRDVAARLKNVEFRERFDNVKEVYTKTRILLVPSLWEEALPRVVRESSMSGIPSIVSNRGGLPESVGHGGLVIKDFKNTNSWISSINKVSENLELYHKLALENSKRVEFSTKYNVERFVNICTELLK